MVRIGVRIGTIAIAVAVSDIVHAQAPACTMDAMELEPSSVIAPCSEMLLRPDLSAEQLGMAFFVRGRGYHRTGKVALAGRDYDRAFQFRPNDDELWLSRSNVYFRLRNYVRGGETLKRAYALNPNNPRIYFVLGHFAFRAGEPDRALDLLARALALDPTEPYSLLYRARVWFDAQNFDAAFKDIDALIGQRPEIVNRLGYLDGDARMRDFHIVALAERAYMFEQMAKYERAEEDLNAAVAYLRSAESLTARGDILRARPDRLEAALADLDEATRLDGNYRIAFHAKGLVLARLRRFEDAYSAFDRAVAIAPDNEDGLLMRGKMQQALGRPDAAVKDVLSAMMISRQVMQQMVPALRNAGYWRFHDAPTTMTRELHDAVQACMIDPKCN